MNISIFGLGYVGAVSCGCLAEIGHSVIGVDVAREKVDRINRGETPIIERGLAEVLARGVAAGRVRATTDVREAVHASDAAFVCVGTPSTPTGSVETAALERVCAEIGAVLAEPGAPEFFVVLNRSTSPPDAHARLERLLAESSGREKGIGFGYVCHPEYLREGAAIDDFFEPPLIVYGTSDSASEAVCRDLYPGIESETMFVPTSVASLTKYAENCYHATKITFANEIGMLCERLDVDGSAVMDLVARFQKGPASTRYMKPGFAFGGSCLPKDLRAVLSTAREHACPLPLLTATLESNRIQIERVLDRVTGPERPRIGLVGLAFKEGTDDVRESPMVALVERLCGKGHPVRIFDAYLAVQSLVGANRSFALSSIPHLAELLTDDLEAVVSGADIVVTAHRLTPERWGALNLRADQRVLDLIGIDALKDAPNYEGLYW